ncbi:cobalamin biosynthesis protein [Fragilariopsis cylindrus CCMP1102]|uniref:Cobalamin biosynthesis protein n=1 Tax=Fragilariopsis cylindrus CCMP1102 TaxID=635003 RepID=A0A1E7EW22_9STRA|nr:cobalamin biosynthesis protein [Fragilariopsis cylindrus CCMP1102]|eukprot:OEU10228.1 cobalamin biosynthesis protein [Fragilariopsis cylindrus CCMP1102]
MVEEEPQRMKDQFKFLLLTNKDTDILTLSSAREMLPLDFPPIESANLCDFKTETDMIDMLNEKAHTAVQVVVICRLLGRGVPGFHHLLNYASQNEQDLIVVSGIPGSFEPDLTAMCTVSAGTINEVMRYFNADGCAQNFANMLRFLADHLLKYGFGYDVPMAQPNHGLYHPRFTGSNDREVETISYLKKIREQHPHKPTVAVLFYRCHFLSGNTAFVDALLDEIEALDANAIGIFTESLREEQLHENVNALTYLLDETTGKAQADVLISTMAFAMGKVNPDGPTLGSWSTAAIEALNVPVLQAITSVDTRSSWEESARGLNPLDTAMNVAIPEFDGRIITVPISFKAPQDETNNVHYYEPLQDRVATVAKQAYRLGRLRHKPNRDKRVAFLLTNSSGKAQRIGDAVGLDTPASLIKVFEAMQAVGYNLGENLPTDGTKLIKDLIDRCSYDEIYLTEHQLANATAHVSSEVYQEMFEKLPIKQKDQMEKQWGKAPGIAYVHDDKIALAGLEFGNAFVALQPPRGYGMDPDKIYHTPDLPPPHNYYAIYSWLRDEWGADAIVHMGKHGTLEWLPGKGVGLSSGCYPDSFLNDLPLIYPFIINDPGEGTQSKRRAHACIIDHMTPPMTTADGYGELAQLMQLVDEYYQVEMLDPTKLPLIQRQIWELIQEVNLGHRNHEHEHEHEEWDGSLNKDGTPVALAKMDGKDFAHLMESMDGYLCELAGAQIRDGLHILGQVPEGDSMVDTLQALTRLPNLDIPSIRHAVSKIFGLDSTELLSNLGERLNNLPPMLVRLADRPLATAGDAIETIDELVKHILTLLDQHHFDIERVPHAIGQTFDGLADHAETFDLCEVLNFVCESLVPSLRGTTAEIKHMITALNGEFIPAGPSGSPTRGMAHLLPTGRNFYSVDPNALPSMAAWEVGKGLAKEVLARYLTESGVYPEHVAISVWGTAAMRTHGDDIAEIFAFLGVKPTWQKENHRVTGIELIPLSELGRPRIDVTIRISGFFRDAFPHLITLLDDAVNLAIDANEPLEQNFIRKHYLEDIVDKDTNESSARYRVFGCPPGAYGIGILDLIEAQNWKDESDFAKCYINWGGYAYSKGEPEGVEAKNEFTHRLTTVKVAIHNQDDREHDIFDSDDYFQFHGGMIATIKALSGKQPKGYFGDSSNPAKPKVRDIKEETMRVYRTRVVNPKWLESISRHGYKGASEMAATVDYLFGFDATADVVSDFMYEQIAQSYALDKSTQDFYEESNPWALAGVSERLLEAAQRGMWAEPNPETLEALRQTLLKADTMLEGRSERPS